LVSQDDKAKRLDGSQISSAQKWEIGSEVLRLRGELQKAVDEERCGTLSLDQSSLTTVIPDLSFDLAPFYGY
jgi:hypothetical protein